MGLRKVYVVAINLLNRSERRRRVIALLAQMEEACRGIFRLETCILEACDGVSQSLEELSGRYGVVAYDKWARSSDDRLPMSWRTPQVSGGIASTMSHLDAMNLGVEKGWFQRELGDPQPILLVAEDDISLFASTTRIFLEQLREQLDEADRLAPAWDVLLFGASESRVDIARPVELSENLEFSGFSYLTTLNAVTKGGATKFRRARPIVTKNCLVFDELHNTLAGLSFGLRPDLALIFGALPKLIMLTAKRNLARQEPKDCVHDTEVSACSRRKTANDGRASDFSETADTESARSSDNGEITTPEPSPVNASSLSEPLFLYSVPVADKGRVKWWRRSKGLTNLDALILGRTELEPSKDKVCFSLLTQQWGC